MNSLRQSLLYLLIATIPIQLGKHFWPQFSFVNGIRVDYLSPTFYISDGLFLLLFLVSFRSFFRLFKNLLFLLTLGILVFSGLFSEQPLASFYGILKFIEFSYLAFFIASGFKKTQFVPLSFIFVLLGICQTIILYFQFLQQKSLGGVFYFIGERTFTASTSGISTFQWGNELFLRPYGTFPHPNVAAFYLLIGFTLLLFLLKFKSTLFEFLKISALVILFAGIVITFSRIVLVISFFIVVARLLTLRKKMSKRKTLSLFWGSALVFGFILLLLFRRFEANFLRDVFLRLELLQISFWIFLKSPLIGIGLNNFFFHEVEFQKTVSPILLQPVHNIYVMWLVQTGILGLILLFAFLRIVYRRIISNFNVIRWKSYGLPVSVLVTSIFIIGMLDHYFITLQQGQLMTSVLLGLLFVKSKL